MKINQVAHGTPPPSVKRVLALLARLPDDEVIPTKEVAGRLKFSHRWINGSMGTMPEFSEHTILVRNTRWWGKPKAIAALRKML